MADKPSLWRSFPSLKEYAVVGKHKSAGLTRMEKDECFIDCMLHGYVKINCSNFCRICLPQAI